MKCPGQDIRNWSSDDVYDVKCRQCGNIIEFFKDDPKRSCTKCKSMVVNPKLNIGCLEWCQFADACGIGELI